MADLIIVDGALQLTCGGDLIFCDTLAESYLCCQSCINTAGDESWFQILAPCAPINVAIAGVANNGGCGTCTTINDDWELPRSDVECRWDENFSALNLGKGCRNATLQLDINVLVCCDNTTDEIVAYLTLTAVCFGSAQLVYELDRQPIVDGECYFVDFTALLGGGGLVLDCDDDTAPNCATAVNGCTDGSCEWTGATFTLTAA